MKICVATTSRSDFGLIKNLIFELKKSNFKVQVIVGGSHFLKEFGNTFNEIINCGIKIDKKIFCKINSNSTKNVSYILSRHIISGEKIFKDLNPDLLVVLGDRYEMLGITAAAHISRIPIAHIHGGEITSGAVDDAIRHSITKMSQIHFAANKTYRNRIIQMGESPKSVFVVGGLGVDSISKIKLLSRNDLEKVLNIKFSNKNLIICFHPETLKKNESKKQIKQLLSALCTLKDTTLIFTRPGLDLDNEIIVKKIKTFVKRISNAYYFPSLGQENYFSILNISDAVVGNSSSGILEMPTFKKATINIGDRQSGRLRSASIIDCKINKKEIINSLKMVYSKKFQLKLKKNINHYGPQGASAKIVKILKKINLKNILIKKFYDINSL
jgi:GDP/UDP-N,N'-diacetylbacillosamine 2-epimerase (hydrolysing)